MGVSINQINYIPPTRLIIIVGNYGSGKTEVSVNLAVQLAQLGKKVQIADLDIVNPYFRSREARETMENLGVRVVVPPGAQQFADLPIVLPEIKGMLTPSGDDVSIFDVGGDDVGAKMLSSFRQYLGAKPYTLLQVINSRRPFTDSVEGCLKMMSAIELSSRLKVSGFIANSHLIDQTTPEVILEGYEMGKELSQSTGQPLAFVTAMGDLAMSDELSQIECPVVQLERIMLPPWLQMGQVNDNGGETLEVPAGRIKPIGQP